MNASWITDGSPWISAGIRHDAWLFRKLVPKQIHVTTTHIVSHKSNTKYDGTDGRTGNYSPRAPTFHRQL